MSLVEVGSVLQTAKARRHRPLLFALLAFLASSAMVVALGCGGSEFTLAPADSDGGMSADGAGAPDADAGAFCASMDAYDFCADFDEEPLNVEWNNVNTAGGATGAEDNAASVSPPNSYLAISPALGAADSGSAPTARAILTELSLPKGATHIAFDLRIDELNFPNGSDPLASVVIAAYSQGTGYTLALEFHPSATTPFAAELLESITNAATMMTTLKLTPLPGALTSVGVWYHVTLDFAIDGASNPLAVPASLGVTSGDPPVTSTKTLTLSPPVGTALAAARTLSVGAQVTAAVGAAKIRFDNVTYKH
jgi:hypothetical protein